MKPQLVGEDSRARVLARELEDVLGDVPRGELPDLLADVERIKAAGWLRLTDRTPPEATQGEERLLTAPQAAERLGVSEDWLRRHQEAMPFLVRLRRDKKDKGRASVRFSAVGLDRWIRTREGRTD